MDDDKIIELYFAREERAIHETELKYGKLCQNIAYNILHNREDAEECVNDTYMGVWSAIPPARPRELKAFICKIARNLSLKRFERLTCQKRANATLLVFDELAEVLPDSRIVGDAGDQEIGNLISGFLQREKEDIRKIFVRRYYFFDSIGEIASRYGFTESKVKSILYHVRIKLKDFLIKEGIQI